MQALHAPPCAGSMCALHCPWATAAMHKSAPCAARLCTLTPSPAQLRVRGSRLAAAAAAAGLLARCDRAPAQPQPGPHARLLPCPLVTPSPICARPHAADRRHRRVHIPLVHAQHHAQQQWHALVPAVQRRRPGLGRHRPRRAGARGAALHRSAVWPEWRIAVMEHGSIAAEPHITCLRRLPGPHLTCCGLTCMGEDDSVCNVAQSDTPTWMLGSAVSARRGCQLPSSAGWLGAHRVGGCWRHTGGRAGFSVSGSQWPGGSLGGANTISTSQANWASCFNCSRPLGACTQVPGSNRTNQFSQWLGARCRHVRARGARAPRGETVQTMAGNFLSRAAVALSEA